MCFRKQINISSICMYDDFNATLWSIQRTYLIDVRVQAPYDKEPAHSHAFLSEKSNFSNNING